MQGRTARTTGRSLEVAIWPLRALLRGAVDLGAGRTRTLEMMPSIPRKEGRSLLRAVEELLVSVVSS
jgi:hypothetical protein